MKNRFSLLDAARFFAAFWVMNFHYFLGVTDPETVSWYRYGNLGVQLFFIISGFVIVRSIKGKSLKEFSTGRFIRLFPLFWILCTITYLITFLGPSANILHFSEYLRSMTMLGNVLNGTTGFVRLVDPSYWTLTVELIFYSGIGIFVYLFSYRNIRYFLGFWLLGSAIAFMYHVDQNFYVKLALVSYASYFVFGSALALIAAKEARTLYERYFDWALLCASSAYSIYIHARAIATETVPNPLDNAIVTALLVVFFVVIPILVYVSRYIKNPRIVASLTILGGLTYPLYLLHQKIGNLAINYVHYTYNISWNKVAVAFEVIIIAVAYFVYLGDKKMRWWLKKRLTFFGL